MSPINSSRSRAGRKRRPPGSFGDRRAGEPFQPEPLDEQAGSGPFHDLHSTLDDPAGICVLAPVGWDEPSVLRPIGISRKDRGHRRLYQLQPDVRPLRIGERVVEVEEVEGHGWLALARRPPGEAGNDAILALCDPQPFRPTTALLEIVRDLVVEDIRQLEKRVELGRPGQRSNGDGAGVRGQGPPS